MAAQAIARGKSARLEMTMGAQLTVVYSVDTLVCLHPV